VRQCLELVIPQQYSTVYSNRKSSVGLGIACLIRYNMCVIVHCRKLSHQPLHSTTLLQRCTLTFPGPSESPNAAAMLFTCTTLSKLGLFCCLVFLLPRDEMTKCSGKVCASSTKEIQGQLLETGGIQTPSLLFLETTRRPSIFSTALWATGHVLRELILAVMPMYGTSIELFN